MVTLIYIAIAISIFALGVCLGAIVENKRLTYYQIENRMQQLETTTQEIYVSLATQDSRRTNYTLVDLLNVDHESVFEEDPDATQEIDFNG